MSALLPRSENLRQQVLTLLYQISSLCLAKRILEQGASVTEACYESGFNDCSYFIKCFRKSVGFTPYQYRKQVQKE